MIVEVVAVGSELLLGQIANTNARVIAQTLAEHGFDAHYQAIVGDNLERIAGTLRQAAGRADAVIVTGGIGPTQDDLTREALATAMGVELDFDKDWAAVLTERFAATGREMPESNLRQAQYPRGATVLPNPKGTAPALAADLDRAVVFLLPGVPEEMELLLSSEVIPRLTARRGEERVLVSRIVRSWGRSEAQVGELLADLFAASNPSIAFLASGGEIKIRITAAAPSRTVADLMIDPVEAAVRDRLGWSVFASGDDTIESIVLGLLADRGWTLATAESMTGGLVAGRITAVPGASQVFRGSVVAYSTDVKRNLLAVSADSVVSEAAALEMALGARQALHADVAVAVTGSAGPEPLEKEVGTVVFAVVTPQGTRAQTRRLPGDRERVRVYATTSALHLVRLAVNGEWWN